MMRLSRDPWTTAEREGAPRIWALGGFRHKIQILSRDVHDTFLAETETRRCSFRDAGRELEASETLESLGSFNVSPRRFP